MADSRILPAARARLVDAGGLCAAEYYRFFQRLSTDSNTTADQQAAIDRIEATLANGGAYLPKTTMILGGDGISVVGTLANGAVSLNLANITPSTGGLLQKFGIDGHGRVVQLAPATTDDLSEGTTNRYFTRARVAGSLAAGSGISLITDPASGITTIGWVPVVTGNDLSDWANIDLIDWSGVQLTDWAAAADSVTSFAGRTGDVLPQAGDYTTSIVAEGTGLYFTAARVLATVLSGLSTATNAVITASDTVLQAFGKLQAQISSRQVIGDSIPFPVFPLSGLPSVAGNQYKAVYVTGLTGGDEPCYSDGTNWRRFSDRSIAN